MLAPPEPAAFGRAVTRLRQKQGLTQEELAYASGLHPTYISGIETGKRNPSLASIRRIATGLGVRASELLRAAERDR